MIFQTPPELPQPDPAGPDQRYGEYSLEYFLQENIWYIVGFLVILGVVLIYSWYLRKTRRQNREEND